MGVGAAGIGNDIGDGDIIVEGEGTVVVVVIPGRGR